MPVTSISGKAIIHVYHYDLGDERKASATMFLWWFALMNCKYSIAANKQYPLEHSSCCAQSIAQMKIGEVQSIAEREG